MAGTRNWNPPDRRQLLGSEYGGVSDTIAGGIQPKGPEALTNGEKLRLGYLVGDDTANVPGTLEDRRQMLGLRPANGKRPLWLDNVSPTDDPRLTSEVRRQGYGEE